MSMYYPPNNQQNFYAQNTTPGQFGPPPAPPSFPSSPSRPFNNVVLLILCIAWVVAFLCCASGKQSSLGVSLFLGILANVLIIDRKGFSTLNGRIIWSQARGKKKALLWCLFIFFLPFVLGFYLGQHVLRSLKAPSPQIARGTVSVYARRSSFGCLTGVVVTIFCTLFSAGMQSSEASPQTSGTVTKQQSNAQVATTKKSFTPTVVPTLAPTPTPTTTPTPTPIPPTATPVPTQAPVEPTQAPVEPTQPPAVTTGVNGNPWGYDFNPGNFIYDPPANFCMYFNCIASFWKSTNGYVDECNDGTFSHSGGRSGACSSHGGEMRPLYSH